MPLRRRKITTIHIVDKNCLKFGIDLTKAAKFYMTIGRIVVYFSWSANQIVAGCCKANKDCLTIFTTFTIVTTVPTVSKVTAVTTVTSVNTVITACLKKNYCYNCNNFP